MEKKIAVSVEYDADLRHFNTFGMPVKAKHLIHFGAEEELPDILRYISTYPGKVLFVGGGSNLLFTEDWDGLVIKVETSGIEILEEDDDFVYVRAEAGVVWDDLVNYSIKRGLGGLENLSLIPGTVGSSPVQNIGAYGVEMKDVFYMLEAVSVKTGEFREFYHNECQFDYRYSVFKGVYKGVYLILAVIFKLRKNPILNLSYSAIADELAKMNETADIQSVSRAVVNIRRSKLPDPAETGNAGSFFKNPVLTPRQFAEFRVKHPEARYFETEDGYKIAAGWMIESCGWKGYRDGDAGVHPKQALVLVNYGNATGKQIRDLSVKIADSVYERFGVVLEPEVNIL